MECVCVSVCASMWCQLIILMNEQHTHARIPPTHNQTDEAPQRLSKRANEQEGVCMFTANTMTT